MGRTPYGGGGVPPLPGIFIFCDRSGPENSEHPWILVQEREQKLGFSPSPPGIVREVRVDPVLGAPEHFVHMNYNTRFQQRQDVHVGTINSVLGRILFWVVFEVERRIAAIGSSA